MPDHVCLFTSLADAPWETDAASHPLLSEAQEVALFGCIRSGCPHDAQARTWLVAWNQRLVTRIVHQYIQRQPVFSLTMDDLLQEANLGLLRAIDRYDLGYGGRFSTFATETALLFIKRAIDNQERLIRLPVHVSVAYRALYPVIVTLEARLGRLPTPRELADAAACSLAHARKALRVLSLREESLDMPVSHTNEWLTLADFIPDPLDVEATVLSTVQRQTVEAALKRLPERKRQIVRWRFGFVDGEPHTLEDVATRFGVTRQAIDQALRSAFAMLRTHSGLQALVAG